MNSTSSSIGYGQQEPNSTSDEFNKVTFLVRQLLSRLVTSKLVEVKAVTGGGISASGTVDVLPLVSQVDGNNNVTPHGTVFGLQWFRLQGGKNAVICDPQVGDVGFVVAADRDISAVKKSPQGGAAAPGSLRQFDIADGIYVGGWNLNLTPDQYLIFTTTGIRIVDKNGNSVAMSSSGITITESHGNMINLSATGMVLTDVNANQIQMKVGAVNIVTASFQVNGVPVTVP